VATADALHDAAVPAPGFAPAKGVVARSPWQHAWARLRKDKVGIASVLFIGWLFLFAAAAPLFEKLTNHPLNKSQSSGTDDLTLLPVKPLHGCSSALPWTTFDRFPDVARRSAHQQTGAEEEAGHGKDDESQHHGADNDHCCVSNGLVLRRLHQPGDAQVKDVD